MLKIQEVDEQELCRQIFYYVEGMSKDCECKSTVGCGSNLVDVFFSM